MSDDVTVLRLATVTVVQFSGNYILPLNNLELSLMDADYTKFLVFGTVPTEIHQNFGWCCLYLLYFVIQPVSFSTRELYFVDFFPALFLLVDPICSSLCNQRFNF